MSADGKFVARNTWMQHIGGPTTGQEAAWLHGVPTTTNEGKSNG